MAEKIVKGGFRATLALIIAIIALIFSIISYQRTGGMVGVSDEIKALQKKTGAEFSLELPDDGVEADLEVEKALFRAWTEAVKSSLRDNATAIRTRLDRDGDWLELELQFNGSGLADYHASGQESLSLDAIRERIAVVRGVVEVCNPSDEGMMIRVTVPVGEVA